MFEWAQYRTIVVVFGHKVTKIVTVYVRPGVTSTGLEKVTSYHLQRSVIISVPGDFARALAPGFTSWVTISATFRLKSLAI